MVVRKGVKKSPGARWFFQNKSVPSPGGFSRVWGRTIGGFFGGEPGKRKVFPKRKGLNRKVETFPKLPYPRVFACSRFLGPSGRFFAPKFPGPWKNWGERGNLVKKKKLAFAQWKLTQREENPFLCPEREGLTPSNPLGWLLLLLFSEWPVGFLEPKKKGNCGAYPAPLGPKEPFSLGRLFRFSGTRVKEPRKLKGLGPKGSREPIFAWPT